MANRHNADRQPSVTLALTGRMSTPLLSASATSLKRQSARPPQKTPPQKRSRKTLPHILSHGVSTNSEPPGESVFIGTQELDDRQINESLDHIILAIDIKERNKVGCAYYVAESGQLFCMEDIPCGGVDIVEKLKVDIQPTVVLLSPRVDIHEIPENRLRATRQVSLLENENERLPLPYQVDYRPSSEFSYDGAKNKLVNLQSFIEQAKDITFLVPGESSNYDHGQGVDELGSTRSLGNILRMSKWLDMNNTASVGCVGAVITYLQRKKASEYLPDDPQAQLAYLINDMEMFSLQGTMYMSAETLASLQIIQPESHPNAFNQGPGTSGSKESLSIYGLFHHFAQTPQGRMRTRQYFLRPSQHIGEIRARLDFVTVFVQPENSTAMQYLAKSLGRIKNMRTTMTLLRKGVNGGKEKAGGFKSVVWASLLEFCYHTIDIESTLREIIGGEDLPLQARAVECFDRHNLQRIGRMIYDVVDLDLSVEQHRTVVKRGVNQKLDEVKDVYDGMEDLLSQTARRISRTIPANIDAIVNVIYFPQLGFHVTVPFVEGTRQPVYDGGTEHWERMFTTEKHVYFKSPIMHEMDEQLGDLYAMICDIEIEIVYDLAQRTLQDGEFLIAASDLCGELDSLLALTQGAKQYHLTRPLITEDNVINIAGGRHLLHEMTAPSYVPNDTFLVGGQSATDIIEGPSTLLLTGPNYSGKSTHLRSVALTVYLAHIGSFVPCNSATIGLTDKILTRISSRETVSKCQSSFMIDLQQIAFTLNSATNRSLVVIDEFGKGTDHTDGAGLAAGVFRHLTQLGEEERPKCVAATHFHEIFEGGWIEPSPKMKFGYMDVRVSHTRSACKVGEAMKSGSEVTYLYDLRQGRSTLSYGTQCAVMNGITSDIIERASALARMIIQGDDLVSACAAIEETEVENLRDAEDVARAFLEKDFEAILSENMEIRSMLGSVVGETERGKKGRQVAHEII